MSQPVYSLTILGEPQSKGRPRVYRGRGITPHTTREAENRVRSAFRIKYPNAKPISQPINVHAQFWMSNHRTHDLDNMFKLVTDALNGIAYTDDRLIVQQSSFKITPDQLVQGARGKRKRRKGDPLTFQGMEYEPHTVITISLIEPEEQA